MAIYRKDEQGRLNKTAGNLVQRWNNRIFLTEHSVVDSKDYYDIETAANKFITALTDFTEFQLYIAEPNETSNVYVRFADKELKLVRSDGDDIPIGHLSKRMNFYTLDSEVDGFIWMDSLLKPTPDTYQGLFTYALRTWDPDAIPAPKIGETAIALDTNNTYERDSSEWNLTDNISDQLNGWYWMIEFFPDYYFGNGKIVWNGGTEGWDVYTARLTRPDEDTIKTNSNNATFSISKLPRSIVFDMGFPSRQVFDGSSESLPLAIDVRPSEDDGNRLAYGSDRLLYVDAQSAEEIFYDNEYSGLRATGVQDAIDELSDLTKELTETTEDQEEEIVTIRGDMGNLSTIAQPLRDTTLALSINKVWLDLRTRILGGFKRKSAGELGWTSSINGINVTFPIPTGVNASGFFLVFVNGVMRQFIVDSNNIRLEDPPPVGSIVTIVYLDNSVFNIGGTP